MSITLFDLPNEVLVKIFGQLCPKDINNLYLISPFRQKLQEFISLIKDTQQTKFFTNVPLKSQIIIEDDQEIKPAGLLELLEVSDITLFVKKLQNVTDVIPKILVIFDDLEWVENLLVNLQPRNSENLTVLNKLIDRTPKIPTPLIFKHIAFMSLTKLSLEDILIDPKTVSFPLIEEIHFTNCTTADPDTYFQFPKLSTMKLTRCLPTMKASLNFNEYPKLLILGGDVATLEVEKIEFKTVQRFVVEGDEHDPVNFIMEGCSFPIAKSIGIQVESSTTLKNIYAPQMLKLALKSYMGQIVLHDMNIPSMTTLELNSHHFPLLQNIYCPDLELIYADIEEFDSNDDFSFFKRVTKLILKQQQYDFLQNIDLSHLEFLALDLQFANDQKIEDLSFPKLKYLDLSLDEDYTQVPLLNAPCLRELSIADFPGVPKLDNIPYAYPNLERLFLEAVDGPLEMSELTFPKLKIFELGVEGESMTMRNCNFPELEYLSISGSMFQTPSTIIFEAPNLLQLRLENLDMRILHLSNKPKLQSVLINRVETLILEEMDSLIYLDLSYNILTELRTSSPIPNLKTMDAVQSNAQTFAIESGLGMTPDEKRARFGSRYKEELEVIPAIEPNLDESDWMVNYYRRLNRQINTLVY